MCTACCVLLHVNTSCGMLTPLICEISTVFVEDQWMKKIDQRKAMHQGSLEIGIAKIRLPAYTTFIY